MFKIFFKKNGFLSILLWVLAATVLSIFKTDICNADQSEYTIATMSDGGYIIDLVRTKRIWKPITAEGMFPEQTIRFKIEIIGKGEDWSYRNQKGFYFSDKVVKCRKKAWDFGYAWIDADRKLLYLNFYWVSAPGDIIPSDVNGKYVFKTTN